MDVFRETGQRKLLIYLMFYELMVSRKYISLVPNTQIGGVYVTIHLTESLLSSFVRVAFFLEQTPEA